MFQYFHLRNNRTNERPLWTEAKAKLWPESLIKWRGRYSSADTLELGAIFLASPARLTDRCDSFRIRNTQKVVGTRPAADRRKYDRHPNAINPSKWLSFNDISSEILQIRWTWNSKFFPIKLMLNQLARYEEAGDLWADNCRWHSICSGDALKCQSSLHFASNNKLGGNSFRLVHQRLSHKAASRFRLTFNFRRNSANSKGSPGRWGRVIDASRDCSFCALHGD